MNVEVVVAVVLRDDGRVLMVKRKQVEGRLKWSFPGGKIDPFEDESSASKREVEEEVGISCTPLRKIGQWKHPDTNKVIGYWLCKLDGGTAYIREPDKIAGIAWLTSDEVQRVATSTIFPKVLSELEAESSHQQNWYKIHRWNVSIN